MRPSSAGCLHGRCLTIDYASCLMRRVEIITDRFAALRRLDTTRDFKAYIIAIKYLIEYMFASLIKLEKCYEAIIHLSSRSNVNNEYSINNI